MNTSITFPHVSRYSSCLRTILYLAGFIHSLYVLVFFSMHAPHGNMLFFVFVAGVVFSWCYTKISLLTIVALIPFLTAINNILLVVPVTYINALFACLYCGWFLKTIYVRRHIPAVNSIMSYAVDFAIVSIYASLFMMVFTADLEFALEKALTVYSMYQEDSLYGMHLTYIFMHGLMTYQIASRLFTAVELRALFPRIVLIMLLQIFIFGLLQLTTNTPPWLEENVAGRLGFFSPFDDIHSAGSMFLLLLFVSFGYLTHAFSTTSKLLWAAFAIMLLVFITFTLSKTSWIVGSVMLAVYFFRMVSLPRQTIILFVSCILSIFVLLALFGHEHMSLKYLSEYLQHPTSLLHRFHRWNVASDFIGSHPLCGTGIGTYMSMYVDYNPINSCELPSLWLEPENAHCFYLQLAAEIGIPSSALLIAVLVTPLLLSLRSSANTPPGVLLGLAAYLGTLVTGHALLLPNQLILFFFFLLVAYHPDDACETLFFKRLGLAGCLFALGLGLLGGLVRHINQDQYVGLSSGFYTPAALFSPRIGSIHTKEVLAARTELISVNVALPKQAPFNNGANVKLRVGNLVEEDILLLPGQDVKRFYYIPKEKVGSIKIETKLSDCFPGKVTNEAPFFQCVGLLHHPVEFYKVIPYDGVGWRKGDHYIAANGKEVVSRLSHKRASLRVGKELRENGVYAFMRLREGLGSAKLIVLRDSEKVAELTLHDSGWTNWTMASETLKMAKTLSLQLAGERPLGFEVLFGNLDDLKPPFTPAQI